MGDILQMRTCIIDGNLETSLYEGFPFIKTKIEVLKLKPESCV